MTSTTDLLRRLSSLLKGTSASVARPRRLRQATLNLDALEGRVVLSRFGGMGGPEFPRFPAAELGVSDSTGTTALAMRGGPRGMMRGMGRGGAGAVQDAQLTTELQTLRTDMNAVIAGSTVTDAQRLALRTDLRTLATAGFRFDNTTLAPVVDSLLTTLADGTYDADASVASANKDAFTALFSESSVSQETIDQTYTDIVAVARGLNVSTEELNTLSTDRAAIQASLTRLGITNAKGPGQSNLDLVLSPGFGMGGGRRRGGRGRF